MISRQQTEGSCENNKKSTGVVVRSLNYIKLTLSPKDNFKQQKVVLGTTYIFKGGVAGGAFVGSLRCGAAMEFSNFQDF